jgi:hypothetical protein
VVTDHHTGNIIVYVVFFVIALFVLSVFPAISLNGGKAHRKTKQHTV